MSALSNNKEVWSITSDHIDSKYEKCRNITEEIYKRINITFEIKKLETAGQSEVSDHSDQIDSNELSNETDLFACDKSDTISSSTEAEKPTATCEKYININNNEETKAKKTGAVYKRPKKKFRKRVKKRHTRTRSDTEGSSDEALPLSRIVEDSKCVVSEPCAGSGSPDRVMGVPNIVVLTRDLKPKQQSDNHPSNQSTIEPPGDQKNVKDQKTAPTSIKVRGKDEKGIQEWMHCSLCSLTFRGARGLWRHMKMSHVINIEDSKKSSKHEQRDKTSLDG